MQAQTERPTERSVFNFSIEKLSEGLSLQTDMMRSVQLKLHSLFDKRVEPSAEKSDEVCANLPDFRGRLDYCIGELNSNNKLLDNILRHLSEIID